MITAPFQGKAHVYGDDIDTDRIIAGKHTKTLVAEDLAEHVLEDLDPGFRDRMEGGDILVGGENFGCGSSREQAPLALRAAGVAAVVAASFARIFFRNAVNIGLPVLEIGAHEIAPDCTLRLDLVRGTVTDLDTEITYACTGLPHVMIDIMTAGGLVPYLKKNGDYPIVAPE